MVEKLLSADIEYELNLSNINKSDLKHQSDTSSELLTQFFYFYGYEFCPTLKMINVSHSHKVFPNREKYESLFASEFVAKNCDDQLILIREPFNHTYNPAKNVKVST